jgi:hypothetical protein
MAGQRTSVGSYAIDEVRIASSLEVQPKGVHAGSRDEATGVPQVPMFVEHGEVEPRVLTSESRGPKNRSDTCRAEVQFRWAARYLDWGRQLGWRGRMRIRIGGDELVDLREPWSARDRRPGGPACLAPRGCVRPVSRRPVSRCPGRSRFVPGDRPAAVTVGAATAPSSPPHRCLGA